MVIIPPLPEGGGVYTVLPLSVLCWEKCDEKWAYMFNVYKNQQSRQTGSRNLMGPKTFPTIWGTYMKLVTKYQISPSRRIFLSNCWWQKSDVWSQASYRYTILWVAFLDLSDSYFLFADLVGFYTHWTYMHIFLSNYWWRDLIFGHKLHIGTPYRGKRFSTHQIPTSCLPTLLIFNASHNMAYLYEACDQISDSCHQ
jgi:hypothetical protein